MLNKLQKREKKSNKLKTYAQVLKNFRLLLLDISLRMNWFFFFLN